MKKIKINKIPTESELRFLFDVLRTVLFERNKINVRESYL